MVNCSYCGKEIDRQVFCSASHKTLFHRKYPQGIKLTIKDLDKAIKKFKPFKQVDTRPITSTVGIAYPIPSVTPQFSATKKPGYHFNGVVNGYVKD